MSKRSNRAWLTLALCAALAVTAVFALAQTSWRAPRRPHSTLSAKAPDAHGAVALADRGDGDGEDRDDGNDAPDPTHAAISPAQAAAAALAAYPSGKVVGTPELEDEDGVAVYGVHVTAANGVRYDVKVDATTARVLKSDANQSQDDEREEGPNDGPQDGPDNGEHDG